MSDHKLHSYFCPARFGDGDRCWCKANAEARENGVIGKFSGYTTDDFPEQEHCKHCWAEDMEGIEPGERLPFREPFCCNDSCRCHKDIPAAVEKTVPICVCGNRGYSKINEHFDGCPDKPQPEKEGLADLPKHYEYFMRMGRTEYEMFTKAMDILVSIAAQSEKKGREAAVKYCSRLIDAAFELEPGMYLLPKFIIEGTLEEARSSEEGETNNK